MSFYLDASLVVSFITPEVTTPLAIAWFERNRSGELVISPWVSVEVFSALARKAAARRITETELDASRNRYFELVDRSFLSVPIEPFHFEMAAQATSRITAGVRAGDALHLAAASARGLTVATSDRRMAAGGEALGHAVELVG